MSLKVEVISASNVPNLETFGESDPYTTITYKGISKKTQELDFDLTGVNIGSNDNLEVTVKDWERVGRNRLLGTAKVPLADISNGGTKDVDTILFDGNNTPLPQEEEEEEEVDPGPPQIDPATGQPIPRPKKKKKRMGRRRFRGKLSNKPQDFQIRIKVLEGRQIEGSNIKPVCKVSCYNQVKQTRVKKSTNSPFWNETFFFNFNASPAELFDEFLEFSVFNSKKLRSDALIGTFKMDIGMVWEQANHAFANKWLLLSDPEDTMAGAKGYLKFCAIVLGPGDTPPSMKGHTQDESEDIESNLLRPAGVQLRPATFALNVYRCEDIPRMDTAFLQGVKKLFRIGEEQKELVDPYLVMNFAGKEFPSMCEKIRLSMKDWDRVTEDDYISTATLKVSNISALGEDADDYIGTTFVEISNISSSGEHGFLPTFGPCFVNFYGSPREFSELPDEYEDLNKGKGEGVAFRGRALVELKTIGGELPEVPVDDIGSEDVLKIQKFMRKRKYKLHAAFFNATMVSAIDAPVEFEVSQGNYGNKLDDYIAPCASSTQPTNAVFDGSNYYFLPWGGTKPCVDVEAHWEDVSWRLETLNLFEGIIAALEENIEEVRVGIKAKLPTPELAQLLISALDQLVEDTKKPLPKPQTGTHLATELDNLLSEYRLIELESLREMATNLRENATDVSEALSEAENFIQILKNIAVEPQNSMPDVIIWMISGEKRIAYFRIPAHTLLYSKNPLYCGKNCGKMQSIQLQYENQVSILGNWTNRGPLMSRPKFSDSQGKVKLYKEKFEPPPGWRWEEDWYINPELSMLYDKDAGHRTFIDDVYECQMRLPGTNWVEASRPWTNVKGDLSPSKTEVDLPPGWYCVEATMGGWGPVLRRYHLCRRRRWVRSRRLVENIKQKKQKDSDDEEEEMAQVTAPRMFIVFKETYKYQLRAYIYQARDILAMDDSGTSDPFCRISFLTQSARTENIKKSLCPTWDQTLIFDEIEIHGDPRSIEAHPPDIYLEIYDHDTFGEPEFLGRAKAHPMVKLDPGDARSPVLQWFEINRGKDQGGELLAAFELFLNNGKDLPFMPPKRGDLFAVPNGIRPVMQRTAIELSSVTSPSIEFEVSGHVIKSDMIKNTKRNPNFANPTYFFDVMLPKEELYMPPVNVRVRDHRQFGRKPTVGIHVLRSLEKFKAQPIMPGEQELEDGQAGIGNGPGGEHVIDMPGEGEPQQKKEEVDYQDIDWWSKYYASVGEVYDTELEKSEDFGEFLDFCETFDLERGKDDDDEESNIIGQFKGLFKVYPLPSDPSEELPVKMLANVPSTEPEECIVRVYIIRGIDLQPNDPTGLADPYIEVKLGKKKLDSRDEYIPNSINPIFGSEGPNKWRDSRLPKELLEGYCQKKHIAAPLFNGVNSARVGKKVYKLSEFEAGKVASPDLGPADQRLALHILNSFNLIKEHVETRPLYNPLQPGIEQGKLQMWVDVFPKHLGEPGAPFDIKGRKPKEYVLRCAIYNTVDVILDETSITGEKMSDIYVSGWLQGQDEKQKTDIHYRSLNGEGNFNWRFVFPFEYVPAENCVVVKKKQLPDINMGNMNVKTVSLFEQKRLRGFWPVYDEKNGQRELTGKVEMELELITKDEAETRPAGKARDEPNMNPVLEEPNRPETSFLWFTSPFKTLRYIIWANYKWYFIIGLVIILLLLLIVLFIYSFPLLVNLIFIEHVDFGGKC
ncbi:MYOF-like protein [Mya arenaria]|uniref:MYOF-like protein n=1 Tax=Mya arenaria TaxID=6604 RepID=A0ABY7FIH6_MYAAR|nr:MYOF-like protein [Mya arenaria]